MNVKTPTRRFPTYQQPWNEPSRPHKDTEKTSNRVETKE